MSQFNQDGASTQLNWQQALFSFTKPTAKFKVPRGLDPKHLA